MSKIDLLRKSKLTMVISPRMRRISEILRMRGLMTVFRSFAKDLIETRKRRSPSPQSKISDLVGRLLLRTPLKAYDKFYKYLQKRKVKSQNPSTDQTLTFDHLFVKSLPSTVHPILIGDLLH